MKNKFDHIQDRIIEYLRSNSDLPLSLLCKDSCSEIARLVAFWLYQENPYNQYLIIKGTGVKGGDAHDVLMVQDSEKYDLIDPSVWQFLPEKGTIYLGEFDTSKKALSFLEEKYGGMWSISETLDKNSFNEKDDWIKIIESNIKESIS